MGAMASKKASDSSPLTLRITSARAGEGPPHLLVQQADRVVDGIVGAEGVGTDEFGEVFREMRLGAAHRPHLVHHPPHAGRRELPRRLRAREAAAYDVNCLGA